MCIHCVLVITQLLLALSYCFSRLQQKFPLRSYCCFLLHCCFEIISVVSAINNADSTKVSSSNNIVLSDIGVRTSKSNILLPPVTSYSSSDEEEGEERFYDTVENNSHLDLDDTRFVFFCVTYFSFLIKESKNFFFCC